MKFRFFWAALAVFFIAKALFAQDIIWEKELRKPIRYEMDKCRIMLAPADPIVNDSVGIELLEGSAVTPENLRSRLNELLAQRRKEDLSSGHLFFTGVDSSLDEPEFLAPYREVLDDLGLSDSNLRLRVLSLPKEKYIQLQVKALKAMLARIAYWFPSIKRDYQRPDFEEVASGIAATVAVEIPNVIYLQNTLPTRDFVLTVSTHTFILGLLSVYKKFLVNWLLRPGTSKIEIFLKQASISFPFILNYNIFGKFSEILAFYDANGMQATLAAFPAEMANFASTQGLTAFLQTLFYTVVITHGVRGWENSQQGDESSRLARAVSNYIAIPILAVDAVFLAMAAGTGMDLFSMGSLSINSGHLALASLTALGSALVIWPQILNPTIPMYRLARNLTKGLARRFRFWARNDADINLDNELNER